MRKIFGVMVLTAVTASIASSATIPAVTYDSIPTTSGHSGNSSTTHGWIFTLSAPVEVVGLGYYDHLGNGLSEAHQVGIYNGSGLLLVPTTVPASTSGLLVDRYRYIMVTSVTLAPGVYTIGGTMGEAASDEAGYHPVGLVAIPEISGIQGRYTEVGTYTTLSLPTLLYPVGSPYSMWAGPNFLVSTGESAVPEPNAGLLLIAPVSAFFLFRRRVH